MRRRNGFSLVELAVVLGITAALALLAAYGVNRHATGARLRAGAEWTAAVIRQAVRLSWARGEPLRLVFQPGGGLEHAVQPYRWNGAAWVPYADFPRLRDASAPAGVSIAATTYPANTLTITPTGPGPASVEASVHATEGEITVSVGGASIRVRTGRDGEVWVGR